jgi:hypothetical protein
MAGIPSFGTILQLGNGATPTETFSDIAEIVDIPGLQPTRTLVEDTTHNQSSDYAHFVACMANGGKLALKVNYDPTETTHGEVSGLDYIFANALERNYRLVFNAGAGAGYYQFSAIIESAPLATPINGIYQKTYNFQVNSKPEWTAGS